jgi:hypothetical protein
MDKPEKRIDLNSELGMTRRDLIRRGAIVGGTLLWVAPAIQSMAPKAFAQETNGSVLCTACRTNRFDPDGGGPTPPIFTHVEFGPTPECCACLATPGKTLDDCDNTGGSGACQPITGTLPGRCPDEV